MAQRRAFVVAGLGFGDEGKGTTIHWLASRHKARIVVRTGGPQAGHRVVTAAGAEHVFAQFGAGALCGAATHLSRNMLVDPDALLNEGRALKYQHGVRDIFERLTIHQEALVVTPFHAIANRIRELARGAERHGSVGMGVGEAIDDAAAMGEAAIRVRDLTSPDLREKLESIRDAKLRQLNEVAQTTNGLTPRERERLAVEMRRLGDPETTRWTVERFGEAAWLACIVDDDYFAEEVLGAEGCVVFECSQGVLLDPIVGFRPYTTSVRAVPSSALDLITQCGYSGEVQVLGVTRAYQTRHGAGPFVSESPTMSERLPDSDNKDHPWQGPFRAGQLDLVALRYAVEACGGPSAFAGLVVTCVDRIFGMGSWTVCEAYRRASGAECTSIAELAGQAETTIRETECTKGANPAGLGDLFRDCHPMLAVRSIPETVDLRAYCSTVAAAVADELAVPVHCASFGPTELEKLAVKE